MDRNNLNNIVKVLEKLFSIGFCDEKSILKMQLIDIAKIKGGLNSQEVWILIDLQKAIRNKELIKFLSCCEQKNSENKER